LTGIALFRLAFASARSTLNLAKHQQLAGPLCKKYAVTDLERSAPTACKRMVSGTISLPLRGTFHLSLTVLVRYRSPLVFSLAGWSPRIQSGFHVSGFTQVPTRESHEFRLRASNPLRTDFPDCSATRAFCNSPAALWDDHVGPTTPNTQRPQAFTYSVWAVPLSLAATQGIETFFLFLRVLRCVISPGSLLPPYVFRRG
jgi:hypothetical protein